jgi:hypothetical protein
MLQRSHFRGLLIACGAALLPFAALAVERPNLSGSWQWNPSRSDLPAAKIAGLTWVIDQNEDALHVSEIAKQPDGKEVKSDFHCTTDGKECSVKVDGQSAKVSFWYNGATLVELESKGSSRQMIVKRRLQLSADGKSMNVELIPVVGASQAGKMVFEKQ